MDVPRVDYQKLASDRAGESSEAVRQRVLPACERQLARSNGSGLTCYADTPAIAAHALPAAPRRRRARRGASVGPAHIPEYCELDETSKALMRSAMNQLGMSARAFHRVLKLARIIADLAGVEQIQAAHPSASLCEAPRGAGQVWPRDSPSVDQEERGETRVTRELRDYLGPETHRLPDLETSPSRALSEERLVNRALFRGWKWIRLGHT